MRFPSLSNSMLAIIPSDVKREFEALKALIRGISRLNRVEIRSTYFQEPCVLAFLHALFDQLKRLLQILPVNRILDLVVPTQENWVIGRRHFKTLLQGRAQRRSHAEIEGNSSSKRARRRTMAGK